MRAGIIKFIEGERPNEQSIVVGAERVEAKEGEDMRNRARGRCVSGNRKAITN